MHPEIKITALLDAIQETIIFVTVKKIELKSLNFSFFLSTFFVYQYPRTEDFD
jgi:hypothetical protein